MLAIFKIVAPAVDTFGYGVCHTVNFEHEWELVNVDREKQLLVGDRATKPSETTKNRFVCAVCHGISEKMNMPLASLKRRIGRSRRRWHGATVG
jgi:hypothetical protein